MCETHGDHTAELTSGASAGVSHMLTYESAAFFFFFCLCTCRTHAILLKEAAAAARKVTAKTTFHARMVRSHTLDVCVSVCILSQYFWLL